MIARSLRSALHILLLGALAGCAQREASGEAAIALAEALWPGRLELRETHFRTTYFDVTLAVRGDPVTRITFQMDADPAQCAPGAPCEDRLRRAYATGVARGETLKALERAFDDCGVPLLAQTQQNATIDPPPITPVIVLDLRNDNQGAELERLAPCLESFRAQPAIADAPERDALRLRILPQGPDGPPAPPRPLTFEADIPAWRHARPAYEIVVTPDRIDLSPSRLLFRPYPDLKRSLDDAFAEAARRFLRTQGGGHVPEISFVQDMRLDPERIDVVRGYVLACSVHRPGQGPCDRDLAVGMRHDLDSGAFSEITLTAPARDDPGRDQLPEQPGR